MSGEHTDWEAIRPGDVMPDADHALAGDSRCPSEFGTLGWWCTRRPHQDLTHVATGGRDVLAVQLPDGTVHTRRSMREAAHRADHQDEEMNR